MNRDSLIQAVLDSLHALAQTLSMVSLYSQDHPHALAYKDNIMKSLRLLLNELPELSIIVFNNELLFEGKPLAGDLSLKRLCKSFNKAGVEHVTFKRGVDDADISEFISLLHSCGDLSVFKNDNRGLKLGMVNIPGADVEMIASYNDLTQERLQGLQNLYNAMSSRDPLDSKQLISLVGGFIAAFRNECNPLMALVPIRKMDEYTFTHSVNVGILNIAQGMSLGISGELLNDLGMSGMLHDAGKMFIDMAIVQKPGMLSDEEFEMMKTHPVRGAQYLMGQEGIPKLAVITAFEHHMRFDLKGYPATPHGWVLNLCSQMTMISDTFDALRTKRVYKDPWDLPKVCGHMLTLAGSQLNRDLTINFIKLLTEMGGDLPPGQMDDLLPGKSCYCE